jgi:ABC-type Fe3+-hydroxamate transport system substrate-binding protein
MIYTDQLGRKVELADTPKRIISLVPSQTELLYDLGLRNEVIGITKFCIHPKEWYESKIKVGGTKTIDFEKIKELNPDLIIGNKEENDQQQIEELSKHYNVWMSDCNNLKDAFTMMVYVGALVGKNKEGINLKLEIEFLFNQFATHEASQIKVAYFIWQNPFMVAARNTFIDDMLTRCGFINVFAFEENMRYPEVSAEQIAKANPQVIFLSSEPFPFSEKHIQQFQSICPKAKIVLVDGELFSWYGSRLLKAPDYYTGLIQTVM